MALSQIDVMPTACVSPCPRETSGFPRPSPTTIAPDAAFQANTPMPTSSCQLCHPMRLCTPAVGENAAFPREWKP
jgi:hypothetical protein